MNCECMNAVFKLTDYGEQAGNFWWELYHACIILMHLKSTIKLENPVRHHAVFLEA